MFSIYLAVASGVELPKQGSYVCRPDYLVACNYGPELSVALSAYTTLRARIYVFSPESFSQLQSIPRNMMGLLNIEWLCKTSAV